MASLYATQVVGWVPGLDNQVARQQDDHSLGRNLRKIQTFSSESWHDLQAQSLGYAHYWFWQL